MQSVSISKLRANLLEYMERANAGEQILVTSHGRVLATLSPPVDKKQQAREQLDQLAETAAVYDVISPIGEPWDAAS